MLRDLASAKTQAQAVTPLGAATVLADGQKRPRLLVVHHGDPRLEALGQAVGELGYPVAAVAEWNEAISALLGVPAPDVLVTAPNPAAPLRDLAFPRECLARWPTLRALYVSFSPRLTPEALTGRERALAAPFNADQLSAALAALCPTADASAHPQAATQS